MASTLGATSNAEEACRSEGTETVAMYLHGNVAKALAEGLAATIKAQPKGRSNGRQYRLCDFDTRTALALVLRLVATKPRLLTLPVL